MPKRFSTARGREFGDALRKAVFSTGMTAREICEKIDWDPGKLSDLMNGKGGCTEVDLAILLSFCRIDPAERDHLMSLHDETGQKIWWQHFADQQSFRMRTFLEHLWKAKEFVVWQPLVLPGLLQLPDYLRAICLETVNLPHEEIEDRVKGRLAMQQVFRQRLDCTFYMHEQVLLSPVGGADVMRAQLHHVLQLSVRPYIHIRIVPFAAGAHAGLSGSFDLMRFDRHEPVVFLEAENSILVVERNDSIRDYENILKGLDRAALSEEDSRGLIAKLAA
ncbi:helix-turn-helix transcriptional regulator [Lentzea sp. NBRC 102530]|uniref:helix-turn-helix domain-containing protein n=1 Tax=Lentzea sp. NBRC 102530 TaxID=3032201 RepID=UPI0024A29903|nr:helix-turn-helix transcriptional regulator [Lentzea sp. NBRC 102530]GLY53502.1 transcriptional regulator [Lentzea sp. NBRC 102530]